MNILILHSSPRKHGNTAALIDVFLSEVESMGAETKLLHLYDMNIKPCYACLECQKDWTKPNCIKNDDMNTIFMEVERADLIIFASPIYSCYCTSPLKAVMDRMVYALNKYYGENWGPSLWKGKRIGIITTCGYPIEVATDLWEEGVKRYCKHSQLIYVGMTAQRQKSYKDSFMTVEIEEETRIFARKLISFD